MAEKRVLREQSAERRPCLTDARRRRALLRAKTLRLWCASAALGLLSARSALAADPPPERILFHYEGVASCPTAEAFAKQFEGRTTRATLVDKGPEDLRSFRVVLASDAQRSVGQLEVRDGQAISSVRKVVGPTLGIRVRCPSCTDPC